MYEDVLEGSEKWFLQHRGEDKAAAAMHMINLTKGLCKVRFRKEPDGTEHLIGDCPDCRKKLSHDCPVLLRIRQELQLGTLNNTSVDDRAKTFLSAGVRNGPAHIVGLSGMTGKKRKKNPGVLVEGDYNAFFSSYLKRGSLAKLLRKDGGFGINECNSKWKRLSQVEKAEKFALCPTCYRGIVHSFDCGFIETLSRKKSV